MIKPTLSLLVFCLAVSFLLSLMNYTTSSVIAERARFDAEAKRKEVLPSADKFEAIGKWDDKIPGTEIIKEAYKATSNGKTRGYVFSAVPKGYGGNIQVTVGVSLEGKVSGVAIGENKETPGLGSKSTEPGFKGQFGNKVTGMKLSVVKKKPTADNEVQAISGATITSKAVTSAVQAASDLAAELIKEEVKKQ
jgi:Na+-translocating ferredoxin:NAD+ oxidoreductase subunit G